MMLSADYTEDTDFFVLIGAIGAICELFLSAK